MVWRVWEWTENYATTPVQTIFLERSNKQKIIRRKFFSGWSSEFPEQIVVIHNLWISTLNWQISISVLFQKKFKKCHGFHAWREPRFLAAKNMMKKIFFSIKICEKFQSRWSTHVINRLDWLLGSNLAVSSATSLSTGSVYLAGITLLLVRLQRHCKCTGAFCLISSPGRVFNLNESLLSSFLLQRGLYNYRAFLKFKVLRRSDKSLGCPASANLVTLIDQFVILIRWEINLMGLPFGGASMWDAQTGSRLLALRSNFDDPPQNSINVFHWAFFEERWILFTLFSLINWLISQTNYNNNY